MTRRAKVAAGLPALLLIAAVAGILVARTQWFRDKLRAKIVAELESDIGGKAEIGSLAIDWKTFTARIDNLTIHGTEAPGEKPMLRAARVQARPGLRSLLNPARRVEIARLEIDKPEAHLIVLADGRTNVPEPRAKTGQSAVETLLDLRIGRFALRDGTIEVKSPGHPPRVTPWDAAGENLQSTLRYEKNGPRHSGDIAMHPLRLRWGAHDAEPADVNVALSIERNRVRVTKGALATKASRVDFAGTIDNFAAPQAAVKYSASLALDELGRALNWKSKQSGTLELDGDARFASATEFSLDAKAHARDVNFAEGGVRVAGAHADASVRGDRQRLEITGIRVGAPGGAIAAKASIVNLETFEITGEIERFDIRRAAAFASSKPIPYDGYVSGPFHATGELARPLETAMASGKLAISPAEGAGITGSIQARYDGARNTIRFEPSTIALPHTRLDISGTPGGEMRVHLQSSNLDDLLPIAMLPLKLQNGTAAFEGVVSGPVNAPRVAGHVVLTNAIYAGQKIDAFTGDIDASKSNACIANGLLRLQAARAAVQGEIGLENWKVQDRSTLNANVTARNADAASLLKLAGRKDIPLAGTLTVSAHITGTVGNPRAAANLTLTKGVFAGEPFDSITGTLGDLNAATQTANLRIRAGTGQIDLKATFEHAPTDLLAGKITFEIASNRFPLGQVQTLRPYQNMLTGNAQVSATGAGTLSRSREGQMQFQIAALTGAADVVNGKIHDEPFDRLAVTLASPQSGLQTAAARLDAGAQRIDLKAGFEHAPADLRNGKLTFEVSTNRLSLANAGIIRKYRPGLSGIVQLNAGGNATVTQTKAGPRLKLASLNADMNASALALDGNALGDARVTAKTLGDALTAHLESTIANSAIRGDGDWKLAGDYPGSAQVSFDKVDIAALRKFAAPAWNGNIGGTVTGSVKISGPAANPRMWSGALEVPALEIRPLGVRNAGPIRVSMAKSTMRIESMRLAGPSSEFEVAGSADLNNRKNPLDLRVNGSLDLALLHALDREITASGKIVASATVRGGFAQPLLAGRMELKDANMNIAQFPNGLTKANGAILFEGARATIQDLTAESGGGKLRASGFVAYSGGSLLFRLRANAAEVRVRYPEGVSTVANGGLSLTGTTDRSLLSGNVTILRTGFNPRTDLGSLISGSAAPVQTPAAQTGLLGGMRFDVQIDTAPDITFNAAIGQGIQAEASLHLRGTPSNPVLSGRVNITQGELTFFGNKYVINQGSISFYNPVKLEPILNIDLETRARGVDVILTVSGTPSKLNVTYRSDPPLQFSDIVALLATGRAPADPSVAARQTGPPQTWQQMGASALVGQAIANPVGGRLQRFFGVSKLKIDPLVAGVAGKTQTRLTIEQQVTPDITFTYITDVTSTNPQIVRVEWAINRNWSAVAIRDETSSFGIDFLYKKRFK